MTAAATVGGPRTDSPGQHDNPYRTFLTFRAEAESLDRVLDQLRAWLRERDWDVDLSEVGFRRHQELELMVARRSAGGARDFRARLTEPSGSEHRRTELTVHAPDRDEGWLLLDVSCGHGRFVDVPPLARYLIQALDVHDGGELRLTDSPTVITSGHVDELAELVCDPDRHGLVFVAGTDHLLPFDRFVAQVGRWTGQVLGQAEVVVLDPAATGEFTEAMGASHGVRPWTLRTYQPDVDPARDGDTLRHRFLTTERLALTDDGETALMLGRIARAHVVSRALPAGVTSVAHALTRVENGYVIEAIGRVRGIERGVPRPDTASAVRPEDRVGAGQAISSFKDRSERMNRLDRLDVEARDRVDRRLHQQQERIERLEADKQALHDTLADEQIEHAITDEARARLEDEARWLRKRLRELEDYQGAFGATPEPEITRYPDGYVDLLNRLPGLVARGVVFTGDRKECLHLDEVDALGRTARAAWDALLVLADYLRARRDAEWSGGVEGYLQQTPAGYRTVPARRHAQTETNITMRQFGDQRVFPVPTSVSPGGTAVMTAHFKLGRIATISPRMYYLDDFLRTGRVYIGYIGGHPTNTHTR